ncbi:hypothetical protein [Vibrio alginolyticus]|uniref:hypothetical protein n=1 Tax=Vibrio alginolyticus TaxID=663 RepID=UPI0027E3E19C|nr:hypothetical protein [Vibrio alginolyticus]WMO21515.1 hypothetical protein NI375_24900 [Vibrio alginolyticus]
MSGKIDYQAHQQQFWEQLEKQPTLTLAEYCEANGLKYGTAKRYIKRPAKTGGKFQPSVMPKIKAKKTSQGNDWHSLLKEFLVRGAQNPTLTMAAFAKDKGVNGATLRRQFNSMRSLPEFDRLFDLYDEQLAKFQEAKNDKKKKGLINQSPKKRGQLRKRKVRKAIARKQGVLDHCASRDQLRDFRSIPVLKWVALLCMVVMPVVRVLLAKSWIFSWIPIRFRFATN